MQIYTQNALKYTITQSDVPNRSMRDTLFAGNANQITKVKPIIVVLCNYTNIQQYYRH